MRRSRIFRRDSRGRFSGTGSARARPSSSRKRRVAKRVGKAMLVGAAGGALIVGQGVVRTKYYSSNSYKRRLMKKARSRR